MFKFYLFFLFTSFSLYATENNKETKSPLYLYKDLFFAIGFGLLTTVSGNKLRSAKFASNKFVSKFSSFLQHVSERKLNTISFMSGFVSYYLLKNNFFFSQLKNKLTSKKEKEINKEEKVKSKDNIIDTKIDIEKKTITENFSEKKNKENENDNLTDEKNDTKEKTIQKKEDDKSEIKENIYNEDIYQQTQREINTEKKLFNVKELFGKENSFFQLMSNLIFKELKNQDTFNRALIKLICMLDYIHELFSIHEADQVLIMNVNCFNNLIMNNKNQIQQLIIDCIASQNFKNLFLACDFLRFSFDIFQYIEKEKFTSLANGIKLILKINSENYIIVIYKILYLLLDRLQPEKRFNLCQQLFDDEYFQVLKENFYTTYSQGAVEHIIIFFNDWKECIDGNKNEKLKQNEKRYFNDLILKLYDKGKFKNMANHKEGIKFKQVADKLVKLKK